MFKIVEGWAVCRCLHQPANLTDAFTELGKEFIHFSKLSDIAFCIGRLLGSILNKPYVRIPGDEEVLRRIQNRMITHGCIKNSNYLINGECPSRDFSTE